MVRYPDLYKPHWPIFTPALSTSIMRAKAWRGTPPHRFPAPYTLDDLNFLNSKSRFFSIGAALYSVGHAGRPPKKTKRQRIASDILMDFGKCDAQILSDSGGFQAARGKMTWSPEEWYSILRDFAEAHCDWSMIPDIPTAALDLGNIGPWMEQLLSNGGFDPRIVNCGDGESLNDLCNRNDLGPAFNTSLWYSKRGTEWILANRNIGGAERWWSVIQGRNLLESAAWTEEVKHYPLGGIAFPASHLHRMEQTLGCLMKLRREGLLKKIRRVHFLGTSQPALIAAYSIICHELQKRINDPDFYDADTPGNFVVTVDASSAVAEYARSWLCIGFTLGRIGWTFQKIKYQALAEFPPERNLASAIREIWERDQFSIPVEERPPIVDDGRTIHYEGDPRFLVQTEVSKVVRICDVFEARNGRLAVDSFGTLCVINHNTQVRIEGIIKALGYYDAEDPAMVPSELLVLKRAIISVFESENPQETIFKHNATLNLLAEWYSGPPPAKKGANVVDEGDASVDEDAGDDICGDDE